jgi:hypothetical protein
MLGYSLPWKEQKRLEIRSCRANDPRQALPLLLTACLDDPAACLEIRPLSGMDDGAVRSSESSFA